MDLVSAGVETPTLPGCPSRSYTSQAFPCSGPFMQS